MTRGGLNAALTEEGFKQLRHVGVFPEIKAPL